MNIAFRADSSYRLGIGHVMRCLALAEELRNRGARILFISRDYPGNAHAAITQRGFTVASLPTRSDVDMPEVLMSQWDEDADVTAVAMKDHGRNDGWDWLLVDHYGLDYRWEAKMAAHVNRIGVIDDLANRPHYCSVLIDQNLRRTTSPCYTGLVPETCRLFLGPRYALLRPEFAVIRHQRKRRPFVSNRTLCVGFGGTDPTNTTVQVMRAVAQAGMADWHVDVIVSEGHRQLHDVQQMARRLESCTVHVSPSNVATIVGRADFAVGGAGVSLWERCCLGVPSIVAAQAENQVSGADQAARKGIAAYLGRAAHVSLSRWVWALREWAEAPRRRLKVSQRAAALVDGAGAQRIADYLESTVANHAKCRPMEIRRCAY